ncbi:hypothetical protein [Halolamina sediminis]|uniref:hypothetical protein n=1 Tax=Halolamina sediminis TaxID=1480675 RepID=UPI0012AC4E57|nr:hypothetical protein [Halolamina sediminis]
METVVIRTSDPNCPVCGKRVDLVEAQEEGVGDEWRCAESLVEDEATRGVGVVRRRWRFSKGSGRSE